jgi:hypothetical protein
VVLDIGTQDLARLQLVCLVRSGDGYLIRAVGQLSAQDPTRRPVDISFGDPAGHGHGGELDVAVRLIQRWCDEGTPVALIDGDDRLALRADDGTEVLLPRSG